MKIANVLIDGSFVSYRSMTSFCQKLGYEYPPGNWIPTGTVFSFMRDLLFLVERYGAGIRWAVIWDTEPVVRKAMYSDYKAHRHKDESEEVSSARIAMYLQMDELKAILPCAGFSQYWASGHEADDVMATLAHRVKGRTVIVARDKDLYQLLERGIRLYDFDSEKHYSWFVDRFGIEPAQWIEVQALTGDSTDNIRGVNGVGTKTAVRLLRAHGDLDAVLRTDLVKGGDVDAVRLARNLVELRKDLDLEHIQSQPDQTALRRFLLRKRIRRVLQQVTKFTMVRGF